jgi:hypothetical protein
VTRNIAHSRWRYRHSQEVPGERVQRRERLTACNFLPKFLVAEIFRFALESAYPTSGLPDLQQRIELVLDLRRERAPSRRPVRRLRSPVTTLPIITPKPSGQLAGTRRDSPGCSDAQFFVRLPTVKGGLGYMLPPGPQLPIPEPIPLPSPCTGTNTFERLFDSNHL